MRAFATPLESMEKPQSSVGIIAYTKVGRSIFRCIHGRESVRRNAVRNIADFRALDAVRVCFTLFAEGLKQQLLGEQPHFPARLASELTCPEIALNFLSRAFSSSRGP